VTEATALLRTAPQPWPNCCLVIS